MKTEQNDKVAAASFLKPMLFGVATAILICLITLIVFSAIMHFRSIPLILINPFAIAASVLGAFSGGFMTTRITKSNGLVLGAITGFLLFVIVVLLGLTLFKDNVGTLTLVKMAIMVLSGSIGGIAGVNVSSRRRR